MDIIKNKKIIKSFGQVIDQLNTLTGGISLAQFKTTHKPDKMVVTVVAPSVDPDQVRVEVEYDKLLVYAGLPANSDTHTDQPGISLPLFAQVINIPFQVDVEQINASYKNGNLKINLPFAESRSKNRRNISIEQR